ncbi:hypothetical protein MTBBW1_1490006 [Desulfamplus magnetovallimortis]|uniref:Uncharacterized protein n=1 Tax=Desulfamplus magnetovallimortis TaxID=1246637 RepID=A0A1W1H8G2_9BACT|nr:hypothetical protein MTBBW1_1490006 [Desulfamplus magnetovallimortis]
MKNSINSRTPDIIPKKRMRQPIKNSIFDVKDNTGNRSFTNIFASNILLLFKNPFTKT